MYAICVSEQLLLNATDYAWTIHSSRKIIVHVKDITEYKETTINQEKKILINQYLKGYFNDKPQRTVLYK